MQSFFRRFSERHMLIFMLLCYLSIFIDAQQRTGLIGYVRNIYSDIFVWCMGIYIVLAILYLLFRKPSPLVLLIAGFPILAYCMMGLWYMLSYPNTPSAAYFIHLSSVGNVLWLVRMRVRGIVKGQLDETILPSLADTDGG
jgi:hypothetical protein